MASMDRPPDCSSAAATSARVDVSKHALVPVAIAGVTDPDGDAVTIRIDAVTQDEPLTGPSDKTSPDARRADGRNFHAVLTFPRGARESQDSGDSDGPAHPQPSASLNPCLQLG
jgi:hypothetical protein